MQKNGLVLAVGNSDLKLYHSILLYFHSNKTNDNNSTIQQYLFGPKSHQQTVFKANQCWTSSDTK